MWPCNACCVTAAVKPAAALKWLAAGVTRARSPVLEKVQTKPLGRAEKGRELSE